MAEIQGALRRLTLVPRGGPGSGHFGHEGRPGQVGGSQPGDFHEAEGGGSAGGGMDLTALGSLMPGIDLGPDDQKWLEQWFASGALKDEAGNPMYPPGEPVVEEVLVGPSGKAFNIEKTGHDIAGHNALTALGAAREPQSPGTLPNVGMRGTVQTWAVLHGLDTGPEQDGWQEGAIPELEAEVPWGDNEFTSFFIMEQDDKWIVNVTASPNDIRTKQVMEAISNFTEDLRSPKFDTAKEAKAFAETIAFGEMQSFELGVAPDTFASFIEVPLSVAKAVGLPSDNTILSTYSWDWPGNPQIAASSIKEAKEKLAVAIRDRNIERGASPNFALLTGNGLDGESGILAAGFMRVSRGGGGGNEVGISWNEAAGLTPAQQRVAARVAKDAVDNGGAAAWEIMKKYDPETRSGWPVYMGHTTEWPSNEFTAAIQNLEVERSATEMPAWAQRVLIPRGGPGSGHFGHEGRPGKVGGSLPGDFHSAEGAEGSAIDEETLKVLAGLPGGVWSAADVARLEDVLRGNWDEADSEDVFSGVEFWLAPSGNAYNVGRPIGDYTGQGHGEVADAALRELFQEKAEKNELSVLSEEEARSMFEVLDLIEDNAVKVKIKDRDTESGTMTVAMQLGTANSFVEWDVTRGDKPHEWFAQKISISGRQTEGPQLTIIGTQKELIEMLKGETFSYKASWDVRNKASQDNIAKIYEAYRGKESDVGKPFGVMFYADHPIAEEKSFETFDEAKDYATGVAVQIGAQFDPQHFRGDREELLHAFGFVRVSRGGGGNVARSNAGITFSKVVPLTSAQRNRIAKVARDTIENGGEVAYGVSAPGLADFNSFGGTISEWPNREFTNAINGVFPTRSVYDLPAWAQRVLAFRGGRGSGHRGHEGREGERGGSQPGDQPKDPRVPKDRKDQMDAAKPISKPAPPEPVGVEAQHIGPGYRVHLTNQAMEKYRAGTSAALETATRLFYQALGGHVRDLTIFDDPVDYARFCHPEDWPQTEEHYGKEFLQNLYSKWRKDHKNQLGAYDPATGALLVNTPRLVRPDGTLDTEDVVCTALHEMVHAANSGRKKKPEISWGWDDEHRGDVELTPEFKRVVGPAYNRYAWEKEYAARVVAAEILGRDMLTMALDNEQVPMTEADHKNALLIMDKMARHFSAPNLELPAPTMRSEDYQGRMVNVLIPDGLGNLWGRMVPEDELDDLPEGSSIDPLYAIIKGQETFEEETTIRPDELSLNWLDETDPARHPVRSPIAKKPRLDDVTMAVRSKDGVLDRVLETIGGALRELMGISND